VCRVLLRRDTPVVIEWKKSSRDKSSLQATYDAPIQLAAYMGAVNNDISYGFKVNHNICDFCWIYYFQFIKKNLFLPIIIYDNYTHIEIHNIIPTHLLEVWCIKNNGWWFCLNSSYKKLCSCTDMLLIFVIIKH